MEDATAQRSAICFLTRLPDPVLIEFAHEVQLANNEKLDVYIMVDDNCYSPPSMSEPSVKFLQISNDEAIEHGYQNSGRVHFVCSGVRAADETVCISWDKALYYFCVVVGSSYDFVWLIEDDVFIPSVNSIEQLTRRSLACRYDLVTCENRINNIDPFDNEDWYWYECRDRFHIPLPWYRSLQCASGLSKRMLNEIRKFVEVHKAIGFIGMISIFATRPEAFWAQMSSSNLFSQIPVLNCTLNCRHHYTWRNVYVGTLSLVEYLFNTLAQKARLNVYNPIELSTITWQNKWSLTNIKNFPIDFWFHPVKDTNLQHQWRMELNKTT